MSLQVANLGCVSRYKALLFSVLTMVSISTNCYAVEITSSTNFVKPILGGESAHTWSPDGSRIMLAELNKADQRIYLCVYRVETKNKESCIYFINYQPELSIYSIDWTEAYIHVGIGFSEGSAGIYPLVVPNWERPSFEALDIEKTKPIPGEQVLGSPAWDRWKQGLFCEGEDERYGIQFVPKGGKSKKYISGTGPQVTRHYLWYTEINDNDMILGGISRIEKATRKVTKLTTKYVDISVSPRRDEKAALFIRTGEDASESALYAYVEDKGIIGPLVSGDKKTKEQLHSISISPNGKQALLLTSFALEPERLKAVVTIKLLSVSW